DWLHTSPIAIELKLQSLLVQPIKKNVCIRHIKRAIALLDKKNQADFNYKEIYAQIQTEGMKREEEAPFQEAFLRRLLRGEISTEQEVIQARTFLPGE
ncbi:hypothetical protein, partial [Acinetobacter baumannii]|uniref:hypothetical protein n=1 Tax=Acinetobacter baumannii TaxID=470 RepID=UPI000B2A89E0